MPGKRDHRLPITFPALAVLAVALLLILRPPGARYLDLLRQGDEHTASAQRTAAVAAYRDAARLQPRNPVPHLRLARVYLDWGRTDDVLTAVSEAQRLLSREGAAASPSGAERLSTDLERQSIAVHTALSDWLAVVEHAQRLLALAPGSRHARHTLARAYVELREWDAARAAYRTLLRLDPGDTVAHERLGALLLDHDAAAIQHLSAAGTDLAGRLIAAVRDARAADDAAYASVVLGRTLLESREWALAERQFECALSSSPHYADAHAYLGYALDQMDLPAEAELHLKRAVALAPDSAVAHTFLGLHHERLGDVPAARAEYESAYDLDPENPATCVEIGQTWAAEGRYVAAEIWLREAVSLQARDPILWETLARFYLEHNIVTAGRAVQAAAKFVQLSPQDAHAHDLRGWAALQAGNYDTARESLLRAIALDPALASAHYHLGLLRSAEGARKSAREHFIRALDLDTTGALIPLVKRAIGEGS